jgi:hypothetical protein
MAIATHAAVMPRVRWSWLWSPKDDLTWNLLPFWIMFGAVAVLFGARHLGGIDTNPVVNFRIANKDVSLAALAFFLYGPLVDAPHLWGTIARTYTDREEWVSRKRLFLVSLVWFVVGPAFLLAPYAVRAVFPGAPVGLENGAWLVWSNLFMFYAVFHTNKQHWGFISLYKRKNGDAANPAENRADRLFFYIAIWLPYVAMLTAPWYHDFDGQPLVGTRLLVFGTALGTLVHTACHVGFWIACIAYGAFQFDQWRKDVPRNGPKLVYLATVIPLYYLAFSIDPLIAALWIILTGVGHCVQYHRVVWAYGHAKYAGKTGGERRIPTPIFESPWLYAALGITFGLVTMQGPGSGFFKHAAASVLQAGVFRHAFGFLDANGGTSLGVKVVAAFIGGVRLHHFYVDSKIWRVSKSAALAKNLNV